MQEFKFGDENRRILTQYVRTRPTLNVLSIINKDFQHSAEMVFNPANAMMISKNDGYFNNGYNNQRDCFINCNTLLQLSRSHYSDEEKAYLKSLKTRV